MSATDQDAVSPPFKGFEDKGRVYPSGAHDAHDPDIGSVFLPRSTGKVSAGVGAPVAQNAQNLWFKAHTNTPSISDIICSVVKCLPVMAPLGQAATQVPQPLQSASLILETFFSSSKVMAL